MSDKPLLVVNELQVEIDTPNGTLYAVDGVNLQINRGEIFALVGESGCGKSMTALSISRLLPDNAHLCQGSEIFLDGLPLHRYSENKMRKIRRHQIGMIFQDPSAALNPVMTIGAQLSEAITCNGKIKSSQVKTEMISLLEKVRISDPKRCLTQYPHQLSGGMKQRIVIAIALAPNPEILIADEPTTALDVTTQAQVLKLIKDLNKQLGMAILMITHDLGIVAQMADTVGVMYAGHIIERALTRDFIASPKHPYSQQLFAALPERTLHGQLLEVIPGQVPRLDNRFTLCRFKDRCRSIFKPCEVVKPNFVAVSENHAVRCHWYDPAILKSLPRELRIKPYSVFAIQRENLSADHASSKTEPLILQVSDLKVHFPIRSGIFKRTVGFVKAVDGISLNLHLGKTLAIVGESGCGKTTVAKAILRLIDSTEGKVLFQNQDLLQLSEKQLRKERSHFQMIFQDPYSSMDPRMRICDIIEEGMKELQIGTDEQERQERIDHLLDQVGLSERHKARFPHELSGGQRQRVAIARALAVGAELIICDEPTSALDVSVQAQILNLLSSLQKELSISYLFITHNLGVVHYLADYIAVMYFGKIVEYGTTDEILHTPKHPYTKTLLEAVPTLTKVVG